jgi:hypothetical protein
MIPPQFYPHIPPQHLTARLTSKNNNNHSLHRIFTGGRGRVRLRFQRFLPAKKSWEKDGGTVGCGFVSGLPR